MGYYFSQILFVNQNTERIQLNGSSHDVSTCRRNMQHLPVDQTQANHQYGPEVSFEQWNNVVG